MADQQPPRHDNGSTSQGGDPYAASNAPNYAAPIGYEINPRTGTLQISISPPPLFDSLGGRATPGIHYSQDANFLNRQILGLPLGWLYAYSFILDSKVHINGGSSYFLDPDYASGMRYYTIKGIAYIDLGEEMTYPHDAARTYSSMLQFVNGDNQYFDSYGRLVGMDDRFGNFVSIEYDRAGDVLSSKIIRIIDSYGQKTEFTYTSDSICVTYPEGGPNTITFSYLLDSEDYLTAYVDPLGERTIIESNGGLARHDLVSRIVQPNGLEFKYEYGALRYCTVIGGDYYRLDCIVGVYATWQGVTRAVTYNYDPDSTAHNFTGYPLYGILPKEDSLLLSADNQYRYRVQIDNGILITEHSYNRLHLEMETRILTRESKTLVSRTLKTYPGEGPDGTFPLYNDLRWTYPNYQTPIRVSAEIYNDDGQMSKHIVETKFNDYGSPIEMCSYRMNAQPETSALLWKQTTRYDYPAANDPSHYGLILGSERWDYTRASTDTIVVLRSVNTLTADNKNVAASEVAHVVNGAFSPDKRRSFEYDSRGRVTYEELAWIDGQAHEPQRSQSWTSYQERLPTITTTVKNVLNQTSTSVVDATTGWMISASDATGATATYAYDNLGRHLTVIDPLGVETRCVYDDIVGTTTIIHANGYETYTYSDGFGNRIRTADNGLNGEGERSLSLDAYNHLGQLIWEQGILGEASRISHTYGDRGQLQSTTDSLGNVTSYEYDPAAQSQTTSFNGLKVSKTVSVDEVATKYTYSTKTPNDYIESTSISNAFEKTALSRLSSAETGLCVETRYEYNNQLLLNRFETRGAEGLFGRHDIDLDLFGNARQESVEINGGADSLQAERSVAKGDIASYNELNQLIEDRNALDQKSIYTYDDVGRQVSFTNYSGTVFHYNYLANNQINSVYYDDGEGKRVEKRVHYDPLTHDLSAIEELISGNSEGKNGRTYYRDGSLKDISYPDGKRASISYDAQFGRVSSTTDVLANATNYAYDAWGRLQSVEIPALSQRVTFEYYDQSENAANSGRLKSSTLNDALRRTYQYNGFGGISTVMMSDVREGKTTDLITLNIDYVTPTMNVAKIALRTSLASDESPLNRQTEYTYNSINQLTKAKIIKSSGELIDIIEYSYDAANNVSRERHTDAFGTTKTTTYYYDADNKLLQIDTPEASTHLAYDINGNLISDGQGGEFGYNLKDQMIRYSRAQGNAEYDYSYYPDGMRAAKQSGTDAPITFYYDGNAVPNVLNETQSDTRVSYLAAGNERLTRVIQNLDGISTQNLIRGQKDMSAVLDENLALGEEYEYGPYGNQARSSAIRFGVRPNPFQYTCQYTDSESGLLYLRSRYYHPGLKRFTSRDATPLLNRYNYGDANPINGSDPTGEMFGIDDFLIGLAISIVIGSIAGGAIGGISTRSWKGVGYGALAGAVGGAVAFSTAGAITGGLGVALGGTMAELTTLQGMGVGAVTGAVSNGLGGVAGQAAANLAGDDGNLGRAFLMGAVFGGLTGGLVGVRATFRYTTPGEIEGAFVSGDGINARTAAVNGSSPRALGGLGSGSLVQRRIGSTLRFPGGEHEMLVVQHFRRLRALGYTVEDIRSRNYRSPTSRLWIRNSSGNWVRHGNSGGHSFLNAAVGEQTSVFGVFRAVRGLANRFQLRDPAGTIVHATGIDALPAGFHYFSVESTVRFLRIPFSVAYGVQGRVWL